MEVRNSFPRGDDLEVESGAAARGVDDKTDRRYYFPQKKVLGSSQCSYIRLHLADG